MLPSYDIFIENYGPGIIERFNLEYDMNVYLDEPVVAILTQGW